MEPTWLHFEAIGLLCKCFCLGVACLKLPWGDLCKGEIQGADVQKSSRLEQERGRDREKERQWKKRVSVLPRALGARVHYGGVRVSGRTLPPRPHLQAWGPLRNIKKHKQSILNVTQRERASKQEKKKHILEGKGFSSVTQYFEIREVGAWFTVYSSYDASTFLFGGVV